VASERWGARGATGRRAEALAAAWLERSGFRIVARNWRHPEGELDLVADHDGTCVLRRGALAHRRRTGRSAGLDHAAQAGPRDPGRAALPGQERAFAANYRFDVVGVTFSPDGADEPAIAHVAGAFDLNG